MQIFFLIEEPEAHLHPQLQELILNFFSKNVSKGDDIQVIMTSHSPTLVSKIKLNNINLIYEKNHKLYNYPISESLLDNDDIDFLEKYLDVTKSQLFFAKGVIFVEGITEAILLPEFAKLIDRPLDKYAVEIVNINGVSFKPFVNLIQDPIQKFGFVKASIITDDDRCSDKNDKTTYISKDLEFTDDLSGITAKINNGKPSATNKSISDLCNERNIKCFSSIKTFEYNLALNENNIDYILKAIESVHPKTIKTLKEKINNTSDLSLKALMIWLFIRSKPSEKARVAQKLLQNIKTENLEKNMTNGKKSFVVPEYIQSAIYNVTD